MRKRSVIMVVTDLDVATSLSRPKSVDAFRLHSPYPNPFNTGTNFSYSIRSRSHVRLTVYNVLGQIVAHLVDGEVAPGIYTARWIPERASSGIYFVRLSANGRPLEARSVLLVR